MKKELLEVAHEIAKDLYEEGALENINLQLEIEGMINSIVAMKSCEEYLAESEEITEGLN